MNKFLLEFILEPLNIDHIYGIRSDIEAAFRSWIIKCNYDYENVLVAVFKDRIIISANLDSSLDDIMDNVEDFILSLKTHDAMRWNKSSFDFYRPLINLLCFYGDNSIGISLGNLKSKNKTLINYTKEVEIASADDYFTKIDEYLILDYDLNYNNILSQIKKKSAAIGKVARFENTKLKRLTLVGCKFDIIDGEFPIELNNLPDGIIENTIKNHSLLFPLYYESGELSNQFLILYKKGSDKNRVKSSTINMIANELSEISHIFNRDISKNLEDYLPKLNWLSDVEPIGSLYEKSERLSSYIEKIALEISLADEMTNDLVRASHIMKADLATETVKRYNNLKGIMAYEMLKNNENSIGEYIKEQYLPNRMGDTPNTLGGKILSIADKMDDITGLAVLDLLKDYWIFARDRVDGTINILVGLNPIISISSLIENSLLVYTEKSIGVFDYNTIYKELMDVFKLRYKVLLRNIGIDSRLIDDALIEDDFVIRINLESLTELNKLLKTDLKEFIYDIIYYRIAIFKAEPIDDNLSEIETRTLEIANYANNNAKSLEEFFNYLYDYKNEVYDFINYYRSHEISSASKRLSNKIKEMWENV